MPEHATSLPSRQILRAERERVKAEIAQDHELIASSRTRLAETRRCFAESFDRLAESQKLIRRDR